MSASRVIAVSRAVPWGHWTTYADVGEIVYGHRHGGQTVGNVLRAQGEADSAHRTLRADGSVAGDWRGVGGGPEECVRRLRQEGTWDETRARARADRLLDASALRAGGA